MANSQLAIALTDDWEILGHGLGDVETLQFRPAKRLLDLYEGFGVRSTFFIEVMQQLAFEKYAGRYPDLARQRDLWIETVKLMVRRGFDVQLHLHPQWHDAEFDGRWWKLDKRWSIADYSSEQIREMVDRSMDYLSNVIAPAKIVAFRGGTWSCGPPSRDVLEALVARGIKVGVSALQGNYYNGESIRQDYLNLESPYAAYWPDFDDFRKVSSTNQGIVEIPNQTVPRTGWSTLRFEGPSIPGRGFRRVLAKLKRRAGLDDGLPPHIVRNPVGRAHQDHLVEFSSPYTLSALKTLADICIRRALGSARSKLQVLVFQSHTKNLQNDRQFRHIAGLLGYIRARYPEISFMTLSEVAARSADLV
jgi:hypothetical protein